MALSKNLQTRYGVEATYFKVTVNQIDWLNQKAIVVLSGFASEEARRSGSSALIDVPFEWSNNDFCFTPESNIVASSYDKIKTLDSWKDATDS